jgi:hypothetical protein
VRGSIGRPRPYNLEHLMAEKGSSGHWIENAIKRPGALRAKLHVKEGQDIPAKKLEKAEHSKSPTLAKEARLAATLKKMHK